MDFTLMVLIVLSASKKMLVRPVKMQHIAPVVLLGISTLQLVVLARSVPMVAPPA